MFDHLPVKKGTRLYRIVKWFVDNLNWCEGYYYDEFTEKDGELVPVPKPENKVYNWFYEHWLWPWKQTGCVCCNTVRGMMYVAAIFIILWSVI